MIILDTNVLSALMRQTPEAAVVKWLDEQPRTSIWTTSVTLLEIQFGIHILVAGKRRSALMAAFEAILQTIEHRVAPFDDAAALEAGDLMASRNKKGRPVELRDTMIAGIAIARRATFATRNTEHFLDAAIPLVNPWTC
jgi:predicted nucleic acid-binding protein